MVSAETVGLDSAAVVSTPARTRKSGFRVLQERLTAGGYKPRVWAVAVVLKAYERVGLDGRLFATAYHDLLAAKSGLSVANVRRALTELCDGPAPLYERSGRGGQRRTLRAKHGFELTTSAPVYYWVENPVAYVAARDAARTANVLDFEVREQAQHPERVQLQADLELGRVDKATYESKVLALDRSARGTLPKPVARRRRSTSKCLTDKQVVWLAETVIANGLAVYGYGDMVAAVGERGVAQYHALRRHVFGESDGDEVPECRTCETALAVRMRARLESYARGFHLSTALCECGVRVWRSDTTGARAFWVDLLSVNDPSHAACLHEQNRLLRLRSGGAF